MITPKSKILLLLLMIALSAMLYARAKGGNMILKTKAFQQSGSIPTKYTCDGSDISPDLTWEGAPKETKSFALICDDPDAPGGKFTHWVLYSLPPTIASLSEDLPKQDVIQSPAAKQGTNGFGKVGYGGPCPPRGSKHRYFFKLYALDIDISIAPKAQKSDLEAAMNGHILAQAEVMGTYQRK